MESILHAHKLLLLHVCLVVTDVEDSLLKRRSMPEAAPSLQHDAPERVKSLPVESTQPSGEGNHLKNRMDISLN